MIKLYFLLVLIPFIKPGYILAQTEEQKQTVLQQANRYVNALTKYDFNTFLKYVDPKEIEKQGGKEKYIKDMREDEERNKKEGTSYGSAWVNNPSNITKCGSELDCFLQQNITMRFRAGEPFTFHRTLYCTSADDGNNWIFYNLGENYMKESHDDKTDMCELVRKIKEQWGRK